MGMYACARSQGAYHRASRSEEEYDEVDGVHTYGCAPGGIGEEGQGNGVVATSKYCAKAIEDDEDDDEVNEDEDEEDEDEENRVGTEAQSNGDGLDVFEALFKPLSSSQAAAAARHSRHRHRCPTTECQQTFHWA